MSSNFQCHVRREELLVWGFLVLVCLFVVLFCLGFFLGWTFPVLWLRSSLDERNLSWHLMLLYSLPDHLLLHLLSSYHRWQALPSHLAIELWGILASFGCLSKVIWKYMLTKSRNTHRRNSNRQATVGNVNMESGSKKCYCTLPCWGFADLRFSLMTQLILCAPQPLTGGQHWLHLGTLQLSANLTIMSAIITIMIQIPSCH